MKNKLLLLSSLLIAGSSFAQEIFSENFDGGTFPTGWARYNVDGLTPATNVNFVNDAWVVRTLQGQSLLTSTSWYSPVGTSNDWVVTPAITIPASGTFYLNFDVQAQDAQYPDGYKLYISTTGNTVADFTASPIASVPSAPSTMTTMTHDISAYAGQTIYIALRNDSNDKFLLNVDNIKVRQVYENDAALVSSTINRSSFINTNNTLSYRVTNNGSNTITSLELTYNNGTNQSVTVNTNIAPGATATVNHTIPLTSTTAQQMPLTLEITKVNGVNDEYDSNNIGSNTIVFVDQNAIRKVVIEEGTGTWCQWCPRGKVAMEEMHAANPDFIGIMVHNGDPMTLAAYDAAAAFDGFPSAHVSRETMNIEVSTSTFNQALNSHKLKPTEASIVATPTASNNSVTIEVTSTFNSNIIDGNYRMGVIIVENGVTGTSNGYRQANAYSGGASGPMGGYENLPNPVPANQMVYDYVGRALLGGYNGQANSLPAVMTAGSSHNYTFNYTIPSSQNINNLYAVAVIIDNNNGTIVNADKKKINNVVGISNLESIDLNVFPNPATDKVNVTFEAKGGNYTIDVIDLTGRMMSTEVVSNANGSQSIEINTSELKAGNYILTVSTEGSSFTKMIAIK